MSEKTIKAADLDISPNSEVRFSTSSRTVYEFEDDAGKDPATSYSKEKVKDLKVIKWGKENSLPSDHLRIIFANENKPQIISNRIALTIGKGLWAFTRQTDDSGKESLIPTDNKEVKAFLKTCNPFTLDSYNDFVEQALFDDEAFANPFCSVMLDRAGKKVASISSLDANNCRIGLTEKGEKRLIIGPWSSQKGTIKEEDFKILPFFDPLQPKKYFEFALQLNQKISGQPFYSIVPWNGTKAWAQISALIPSFHLAGLQNGSYIRYHVKIPGSYLDRFTDDDKRREEKQRLQRDMDSFLAGGENAHKTFTSYIENLGANPEEWKIETVEGDLKDDSYLKLDDHADKKQSRGHDIHPILSNIELEGKLSSGSEVLNLLNFHTAYKTQRQRERMCIPLKIIQMINGWPEDIEFGFKDVQFTTTDKNPTGQQNATTE